MSAPLQGTASAANSIDRVKYSHDAMIDMLIANPKISQNAIAAEFGYTVGWVSRVFNSDAFQARLAVRKDDIVDPVLKMSIEEKLSALAHVSLDRLQEKLAMPGAKDDLLIKSLTLATSALGYGARTANLNVQQNFVVALPSQVDNQEDWAAKHRKSLQAGSLATDVAIVEAPVAHPQTAAIDV